MECNNLTFSLFNYVAIWSGHIKLDGGCIFFSKFQHAALRFMIFSSTSICRRLSCNLLSKLLRLLLVVCICKETSVDSVFFYSISLLSDAQSLTSILTMKKKTPAEREQKKKKRKSNSAIRLVLDIISPKVIKKLFLVNLYLKVGRLCK